MGYIAHPVRTVQYLHPGDSGIIPAQKLFQISDQLIQCRAFPESRIIHLIHRFRILRRQRQHIHLHHIVNISKITAIFPVPVNHRAFMPHQLLHEQRNHCGIRPERILPASEYIEIAQSDSLHPVRTGKYIRIQLIHILRHSIRRKWASDAFLHFRQ